MMTLPFCDRADNKLLKNVEVNLAELANVEASLTHLVLPELCEQFLPLWKARHQVDTNVALARGETSEA